MFLKYLEVCGFKSFPERVKIEFNKGITGIVGPNGSGKSNISDAIRWVMGEQSVKSLRGGKMEDVIFSGTVERKPVGFAEVSLCFDNSQKVFKIEYDEVLITRRYFRSGESEYYINKASCRLRDIHELLMDTGMGRDGYSVVGQGKIDEIISAKPEDRRVIFEEAAGISKFKYRKQESEKKMQQTEENLVRLLDLILEIESRIEPLKNQAEKAKEFLKLRELDRQRLAQLRQHQLMTSKIDLEQEQLQIGGVVNMEIGGEEKEVTLEMVDIRISSKEGFNVGMENNNFIILDTTLTDELILEGIAREMVSKVQQLRKNKDLISDLVPLIQEELNIKEVIFVDDLNEYMNLSVKPNFKVVGKVFGPLIKEFQTKLEGLTAEEISTLQKGGTIELEVGGENKEVTLEMVDIRISSKEGFNVGMENNNFIILDTTLTDELILEGIAREMVSKVQQLRKNKDFNVADRITLFYSGDEDVDKCVENFAEYIKNETLSLDIVKKDGLTEKCDLNGHDCYIDVER